MTFTINSLKYENSWDFMFHLIKVSKTIGFWDFRKCLAFSIVSTDFAVEVIR